jgi:hypothetical protein
VSKSKNKSACVYGTDVFTSAGTREEEQGLLSISEQILPPLLSIVALYFGVLTMYRTTASLVRTTVSIIKWASIIALLAMGAGYFAAQGNIDTDLLLRLASQFVAPQERVYAPAEDKAGSRGGRTRTQRGQQERRPSIFEPFINHQEWRDGRVQAEDTQQYIQEVVKGAQTVYKHGSGFLDTLLNRRQDDDEDQEDGNDDRSRRPPRTRSQTRRSRRNN